MIWGTWMAPAASTKTLALMVTVAACVRSWMTASETWVLSPFSTKRWHSHCDWLSRRHPTWEKERRKGTNIQIFSKDKCQFGNALQPHKRTSHVSNYDMYILICSRLSPFKGHSSLPHPYWAQCLPMQPHAYIELSTQLYQIDDSSLNIAI